MSAMIASLWIGSGVASAVRLSDKEDSTLAWAAVAVPFGPFLAPILMDRRKQAELPDL